MILSAVRSYTARRSPQRRETCAASSMISTSSGGAGQFAASASIDGGAKDGSIVCTQRITPGMIASMRSEPNLQVSSMYDFMSVSSMVF